MNKKLLKMTTNATNLSFNVTEKEHQHYTEYDIVSKERVTTNDSLILEWKISSANISCQWHPTVGMNRALKADWDSPLRVANSCSAPVLCLIDGKDRNVHTFALSEFVNQTAIYAGIHEEDGSFTIKVEIELPANHAVYCLKLYVNETKDKYFNVLAETNHWWEQSCNLVAFPIPQETKRPMYSTWYAYHQEVSDVSLLEEALHAKQLGMDTMIIDDGWQTHEHNRGYAFTGDWQVSTGKFADFKDFVARNHAMSMKIMIWYSVPFIGKNSDSWQRLSDKLLTYDESRQTGILDVRYKDNCHYLVEKYLAASKEYGLDGLKLDFIDEFYLRSESKPYTSLMDFISVEEGLDYLLKDLKTKILVLNPNFMIEFRQNYIGPSMRQYSNMFRVDDCPKSAITNRVGLVDLRLISGDTSCHSDMVMWHPEETPENVAIQLLSCIFGVIQISVKLAEISNDQKKVVQNYLNFSVSHSDLLLNGRIQAEEPENLYPIVRVESENRSIIATYSKDKVVLLNERVQTTIILNATHSENLFIRVSKVGTYELTVFDCLGEKRWTEIVELTESLIIQNYPGGRVELERLE